MCKVYPVALIGLAFAALAFGQQTVVLNDGTQIRGRYDGGNANNVSLIDEHGNRHRFNINQIRSVMFNNPPGQQAFADRGYQDPDRASGAAWNRADTIPAGTEVVVRTVDPIDVRQADPGRHFLATVDRDVRDANGRVAIPRGANAHLIATDAGNRDIAIDLRSVNVNGQRYILNSEDITAQRPREGLGANQRTGSLIGGGAVLGTILGAIAGGGKGAAIGALAGGAAGAGTVVLTRGREVRMPSETILRFRLDRPVYLYK